MVTGFGLQETQVIHDIILGETLSVLAIEEIIRVKHKKESNQLWGKAVTF